MRMSHMTDPQQHGRTRDNATTAAAATALSKHPTPALLWGRRESRAPTERHVCDIITVRHNKEAAFYDGNTIHAIQSLQGNHFLDVRVVSKVRDSSLKLWVVNKSSQDTVLKTVSWVFGTAPNPGNLKTCPNIFSFKWQQWNLKTLSWVSRQHSESHCGWKRISHRSENHCLEIYYCSCCLEDTVLKYDFLANLKTVSSRQCLEMTFSRPWVASQPWSELEKWLYGSDFASHRWSESLQPPLLPLHHQTHFFDSETYPNYFSFLIGL